MAIQPLKIPQNVYIEDRIVGPLTLKQVLIVAVGGGFSYVLWAMISKSVGGITLPLQVLVWIPGVLSIIFAFVKINDLSMMRLCLLMLERMNKPTTRTWSPRRGIMINIRTFHTAKEGPRALAADIRDKSTQRFDEVSSLLDDHPTKVADVPTMKELGADEPMLDEEVALENPNVIGVTPRPVDKNRITATPLRIASDDGDTPASGSISLFRDISPAH